MKKTIILFVSCISILIIICITCSPLNKAIDKKQNSIKILSYNVRNCRGLDDVTDYKRVADIIIRISPEIVALQELDSATQRSNGKVALDELSSFTHMYKTYGASITYQGGKYGIGILTKEKPVKWKIVPLPGREERRSLLIVELKDFIVCCTHLSLTEEDRIGSTNIISEAFGDTSKPIFLAGDFNSIPGSQVIKNIKEKWFMLNNPEIPTIPSNNPQRCIDYIFAAKFTGHTFRTIQTVVEKEPLASDHLPVWIEVEFK